MHSLFRYIIILAVILTTTAQAPLKNEADSSIPGLYSAGFALIGSYIYIKPDLTFEYRVYGDLYNGNGNIGQLTPLGDNYFLANSFPQWHTHQRWIFDTGSDSMMITVIDEDSSTFGWVNMYVTCNNETYTGHTDKNGNFKLPKCLLQTVRTSFPGYVDVEDTLGLDLKGDSIVYQINQKGKNDTPIKNERWLIQNDSLVIMLKDSLKYNYVYEKTAYPSANEAYTVMSENGNYAIEMLPNHAYGNEGAGNVYQLKNGQEQGLLWSVNWFAPNVSLANDGNHLIRLEPWGSDLEKFSDVAVEFYQKDQLLNRYHVNDILEDTSNVVIEAIGHYRHTACQSSIQAGLSN
ncbi:MAG: hypothetical protein AAFP70_15075, partial [Calditrichota bacterium]